MFLIPIMFCIPIEAQDFELGCRFEGQMLHTSDAEGHKGLGGFPIFPTCFQFTFAIYPLKDLSFDIRAGREFGVYIEDYVGGEFGLFAKYFAYKNLYLTSGIAWHANQGGNSHIEAGSYSNDLYMPAIGLGIKPWNHVALELLFQKAFSEAIGYTEHSYIPDVSRVDWVMKFGVVCGWIL